MKKRRKLKFPRQIRLDMGLTPYAMAKAMNMPHVQYWLKLERGTDISIRNLLKLWRVSRLRADHFLALIDAEIDSD